MSKYTVCSNVYKFFVEFKTIKNFSLTFMFTEKQLFVDDISGDVANVYATRGGLKNYRPLPKKI